MVVKNNSFIYSNIYELVANIGSMLSKQKK